MEKIGIMDLFDLNRTIGAALFDNLEYPWQALKHISDFIIALGATLDPEQYEHPGDGIWISRRAKVAPTASITGPVIIDHDAQVRHCAFIRGSALVGKNAVVGNSTELKNAVLFDGVQAPHFNYVGDSILGYKAHMGAGSITSNVKSDKTLVQVKLDTRVIDTGLKKFGAMLGDEVEIGCNSVLNPGTIIGRRTSVYPTSCVRGVVMQDAIYKAPGQIVPRLKAT